jgi:hypothetical protein
LANKLVIALTIMAAGRAMTIPFIGRAGDGGAGDPPDAWLMPLIGDAAIGLAAVAVAALLWWRPSPTSWLIAIVWSAIGAFDAIAAFIVDTTSPWPDFFMLQLFGRPMFFAAAAMHILIIYLLFRPAAQQEYLLQPPPSATGRAGIG